MEQVHYFYAMDDKLFIPIEKYRARVEVLRVEFSESSQAFREIAVECRAGLNLYGCKHASFLNEEIDFIAVGIAIEVDLGSDPRVQRTLYDVYDYEILIQPTA